MKSQIALIGIGVLVASGVAYAELRPAGNTSVTPVVASSKPVASVTPVVASSKPVASETPAAAATPAKSKKATVVKTQAPKKIPAPAISKPSISGGGEGDDDHERGEREEEDDD